MCAKAEVYESHPKIRNFPYIFTALIQFYFFWSDFGGILTDNGRGGYYVPEDVKLISFDNSPYSTMASPSITYIDRNPELLAKKACEVLLQKINGEETENENIIPVSLVKRDSTR